MLSPDHTGRSGLPLSDQKMNSSLELSVIQATKSNNIDLIKKLLSQRSDQILYGELVAEVAAEYGHTDVFALLRSYGIIDVGDALHKAANNGHIKVLDYLQQHTLATCSVHAMDDAARKGNLEVVKWICRNRPEGCTAAALIGAAANGHVEVMNFLILNVASLGQYIQVACDTACKMGKMNVIKYAVSMWMCGCSPTGLDDLAMFGDTGIIEYLIKNHILPTPAYLLLASDLSDEETIDDEKLEVYSNERVFDGRTYVDIKGTRLIEFDNSDCNSEITDYLDADLDEDLEDEDDVFDSNMSDYDDSSENKTDTLDVEMNSRKRPFSSKTGGDFGDDKCSNRGDVDNDDDDEYDIDDEEDSFDRYIRKKKDTVLTCLFDNAGQVSTNKPEGATLNKLNKRTSIVESTITNGEQTEQVLERKSLGANSIGINDLDTFRLRSIAGETRNFETFRNWSPGIWRESIDNTVDSIVCNPDRMTMVPFLYENLCGRIGDHGIDKACEAGCLDILQWIHKTHCTLSGNPIHQCCFSVGAMEAACMGGQGDVAMWLVNVVHLQPPTPEVAMTAATKGNVSFLEWLYVTCKIELHPETCNLAASSGNCPALIWLYELCDKSYVFSMNAVDLAAINGHMDVIIFLESIGVKSSAVATDGALMNGHMDVYNHLAKLGAFPSRYAARYATLSWPSSGPLQSPIATDHADQSLPLVESTDFHLKGAGATGYVVS